MLVTYRFFGLRGSSFLSKHFLVMIFLLPRLATVFFLFLISGGSEVASDVRLHNLIIENPLGFLNGSAHPDVASYPPLQFLFEYPSYQLFSQFSSEFIAIRLVMIFVEMLTFLLLLRLVEKMRLNQATSMFVILTFILGPHQIFTSSVFVQDEVISQFFCVLALYFAVSSRPQSVLLTLSLGVLIGKIFLIIPFFYFYWLNRRTLISHLTWAPIIVVYGSVYYATVIHNGTPPFNDFTPSALFGSHYGTLLAHTFQNHIDTIKQSSLLLSIVCQIFMVLWFVRLQRNRMIESKERALLFLTLPLLVFFTTFYMHNPEYMVLVAVPAFLLLDTLRARIFLFVVLSMAWLPNILFGLNNILLKTSRSTATRETLLFDFAKTLPIDLGFAHTLSIVLYIVSLATVLIIYIRKYNQVSLSTSVA